MPVVQSRALVLQSFAFSETSKILRLLTPEFGSVSVIAKGARRPRSRFGGLLELFTEGRAEIFRREGRDLHPLGGWDLLRSRQELGRTLEAFAGASLIAEIALRFGTEEPAEALYGVVSGALDRLCESGADAGAETVAGAWALVATLGFAPQTEQCARCGRVLDAEEPARFDAAAGGAACARCRPAGRVLQPHSRRSLARMAAGGGGGPDLLESAPVHRELLRLFLSAQLTAERPLRSLELFLRATQPDHDSPR